MYDQFESPEPDEAVKLALRRIEESTAHGEGSDEAERQNDRHE